MSNIGAGAMTVLIGARHGADLVDLSLGDRSHGVVGEVITSLGVFL